MCVRTKEVLITIKKILIMRFKILESGHLAPQSERKNTKGLNVVKIFGALILLSALVGCPFLQNYYTINLWYMASIEFVIGLLLVSLNIYRYKNLQMLFEILTKFIPIFVKK